MFKTCAVIAAALLLAGCGNPRARDSERHAPGAAVLSPPGASAYRIDASQSELRLLVYRAGAMARLGHNHVIVNRNVGGSVSYADDLSSASFTLTVPVAEFIIDEPQARGEEGPDFAAAVPDDARAGTRRNMLSAGLLNAEDYPNITLTSLGTTDIPSASASPPQAAEPSAARNLSATMTLRVAGHDSTLVVPFMLDITSGRLVATGTVALRQTAMGLAPFSVMLGALQVQDEFTVKFKLVATVG